MDGSLRVELDDRSRVQLGEGGQSSQLLAGKFELLGLLPAVDRQRQMSGNQHGDFGIFTLETVREGGAEGERAKHPAVGLEGEGEDRRKGSVLHPWIAAV